MTDIVSRGKLATMPNRLEREFDGSVNVAMRSKPAIRLRWLDKRLEIGHTDPRSGLKPWFVRKVRVHDDKMTGMSFGTSLHGVLWQHYEPDFVKRYKCRNKHDARCKCGK